MGTSAEPTEADEIREMKQPCFDVVLEMEISVRLVRKHLPTKVREKEPDCAHLHQYPAAPSFVGDPLASRLM